MDGGMAHDGKMQREAAERPLVAGARERTEPAMPAPAVMAAADKAGPGPVPFAKTSLGALKPGHRDSDGAGNIGGNGAAAGNEPRRPAKRRPAGPARPRIAAND